MFAALDTVEPPILELVTARFAEGDKPWAEERLPLIKDRIRDRLVQLPTLPAAKRGPPTSGLSPPNWRSTPLFGKLAESSDPKGIVGFLYYRWKTRR